MSGVLPGALMAIAVTLSTTAIPYFFFRYYKAKWPPFSEWDNLYAGAFSIGLGWCWLLLTALVLLRLHGIAKNKGIHGFADAVEWVPVLAPLILACGMCVVSRAATVQDAIFAMAMLLFVPVFAFSSLPGLMLFLLPVAVFGVFMVIMAGSKLR